MPASQPEVLLNSFLARQTYVSASLLTATVHYHNLALGYLGGRQTEHDPVMSENPNQNRTGWVSEQTECKFSEVTH